MCVFGVYVSDDNRTLYTINLGFFDVDTIINVAVDLSGAISMVEVLDGEESLRTITFHEGTESGVILTTGAHSALLPGTEPKERCNRTRFAEAKHELLETIEANKLNLESYQHLADCRHDGNTFRLENLSPADQPDFIRRRIRTGFAPDKEFRTHVDIHVNRDVEDNVIVIAQSHQHE